LKDENSAVNQPTTKYFSDTPHRFIKR